MPCRRCSHHMHVNTVLDHTDNEEEINTTLPSSQAPWEGDFIPLRRPTIVGKTLLPGMGPLPSHDMIKEPCPKRVNCCKIKFYKKPKCKALPPRLAAQIPRATHKKCRYCRAFAKIKHYQKSTAPSNTQCPICLNMQGDLAELLY